MSDPNQARMTGAIMDLFTAYNRVDDALEAIQPGDLSDPMDRARLESASATLRSIRQRLIDRRRVLFGVPK